MTQKVNKGEIALKVVFYLLIWGWIFWASSSCNPAKIAARKDAKALDRVQTNPNLLQTAFARGLQLWPCINDSIVKKGDTVTTRDTTYELIQAVDSIHSTDTIVKIVREKTVIRDTVIKEDKRSIEMLKDSLHKKELLIASLNQSVSDLTLSVKNADAKADKWLWYFIAACIALVASNITWLYFKIKSK